MTLQERIKQILDEKCTSYSLDDEGDRKMTAFTLVRELEDSMSIFANCDPSFFDWERST